MRSAIVTLMLVSVPAAAQRNAAAAAVDVVSVPALNEEHTATAGDPIWELRTARSHESVTLVPKTQANGGGFFSTSGTVSVPAGQELVRVESAGGVRGCVRESTFVAVMTSRTCLIDTDGNGEFDQFSFNETSKPGKLKSPVSYSTIVDKRTDERSGFQIQILYLGLNGSTLNLSYREAAAGLARPAFNQDLSIPLAAPFPQTVRFKGVEMRVLGVDGLGMRYVLTAAPAAKP